MLVLAATEPRKNEERRRAAIASFSERVPHAEIRRSEGPHLMLEERPEETARAVGEWLRRLAY